jgi:hypothetical protein
VFMSWFAAAYTAVAAFAAETPAETE